MPTVGTRKAPSKGNYSNHELRPLAEAFTRATQAILTEAGIDYASEPARAFNSSIASDHLHDFFIENSIIAQNNLSAEKIHDEKAMLEELYINDRDQILNESVLGGLATYNPLVGLSLPMHKYLMLNCVFAQAVPRYVAKTPSWTETMETRYLVTPQGKKIDIANQQNQIFKIWKEGNPDVQVAMPLPESNSIDILANFFSANRFQQNLSVATHISAIAVEEYVEKGGVKVTLGENGQFTEENVTEAGKVLTWHPVDIRFAPQYGEANRGFIFDLDTLIAEDDAGTTSELKGTIFGRQDQNLFTITCDNDDVVAVRMSARLDASQRTLPTNKVQWEERTTFVQIPENDGITVPITPEEVKDVGASYGINQVTKYMSIIKDILENVKDDDIKEQLEDSFDRLDDDHKLARTIDFAPPERYNGLHTDWLHATFMDTFDMFVTGLLTVLRDPNMEISIIGRQSIIRRITPVDYSYSTPSNVGPIELAFKKTVVTSDKRVYNFIGSDKLQGDDNLIILLNPKNTNRIVYRLYDYQMYISNEIRDAANPQLPALTAFQRYKFFEYQPVQGRLFVANPTGLREMLPNVAPTRGGYANNDLASVYSTYNPSTGLNEYVGNVLPETAGLTP